MTPTASAAHAFGIIQVVGNESTHVTWEASPDGEARIPLTIGYQLNGTLVCPNQDEYVSLFALGPAPSSPEVGATWDVHNADDQVLGPYFGVYPDGVPMEWVTGPILNVTLDEGLNQTLHPILVDFAAMVPILGCGTTAQPERATIFMRIEKIRLEVTVVRASEILPPVDEPSDPSQSSGNATADPRQEAAAPGFAWALGALFVLARRGTVRREGG